ncbi:hypothetical protein I546_3963 [Mycobacterium kansasii 732]|nr:hypothetical protein I546_3963 [Mycobacterium kansasii 732]
MQGVHAHLRATGRIWAKGAANAVVYFTPVDDMLPWIRR